MKLKMRNFEVKDIVFGDKTELKNNILSINKEEALQVVNEDPHITFADIKLAKPGDNIRIVPIKDAIEPRYKEGHEHLFPGVTGYLNRIGEGTTNALKNISVLAVGNTYGSFGDGLVDMSGAGADLTFYSKLMNVCLLVDTDEEFERHEQQKKNRAIRWGALRLAEYLGKVTIDLDGYTEEVYELKEADDSLPRVGFVMQCQSQMEESGYNTLFYGWDMNKFLPTFIHPNEVLDGAIVDGSFMPCSSKWATYDYQNHPTIKELMQEHGKTINFVGVILSNLNVAMDQKERSALVVSNMAKTLRLDGAILAEEGYGNPDADFIACFDALEEVGVKTVGMTNECTGRDGLSQPLVSLSENANAIVSCGNVSELIELPPMETVYGNLTALAEHGLSGGWSYDEILGSSVREDGSIIMENNSSFCGDQVVGWSTKKMEEF